MADPSLGLIGGGKMAEAITRAVTASAVYARGQIVVSDPSPDRRKLFEDLGIQAESSNDLPASSPVVILCVKPQQASLVLQGIRQILRPGALFISIAAGISTGRIARELSRTDVKIVRAMPNTPLMVGKGLTVLSPGPGATTDDLSVGRRLFEAGGQVLELPEDALNAVTAISGSGPAYVFLLQEALARAGTEVGLSPDDAERLARGTIIGAGAMLDYSPRKASELRQDVTSPGGTTEAGIDSLTSDNFMQIVTRAVSAATRRAEELGS
jgi:pyrroline-5-carboxylate reductase